MDSSDVYDGSAAAFEGDKTLLVRSLPAGARIKRATLTVTPVAARGGTLFEERIDFGAPADPARTLGATKITGSAAGAAFVEVDFHKRRTLASVTGTNVNNTTLQVDLGGVYVEINQKGSIVTPTDPAPFAVDGGTLPGLTVGKFKLTAAAGAASPDLNTVTIRSAPSNLSVRLGKTAPFWTHAGELAAAVTSPDFAVLLQTFLTTAPTEHGYYLVPLMVHSDGLSRIRIQVDIGYVYSAAATPSGLGEAVFPFDSGTVSNAPVELAVSLPPDARVIAGDTSARVMGQFASTRIDPRYGAPTGTVSVVGAGIVQPSTSLAQIIAFGSPASATAIDLSLTGVTRTAQLGLDLRADLDGKPDGSSLIGGPVAFTFQSAASSAPGWVSVALPKEFHFAAAGPARYWIIVQSFEGEVQWNIGRAGSPEANTQPLPAMQQTADDGLSWRSAVVATSAAVQSQPLAALYRLRYQPAQYQVPIEVQVGTGDRATRVKLDRYQPLNRVDFTVDAPELATGFNAYLNAAVAPSCSRAEHVANGDFRQWVVLGNDLGAPHAFNAVRATGTVALSNDGQFVYAGAADATGAHLFVLDAFRDAPAPGTIPLQGQSAPLFAAASPDGTRIYVGTATALHVVDAAARADLGPATGKGFDLPRLGTLSPDGAYLYVATATSVQTIESAALEDAVRARGPVGSIGAAGTASPGALAVSPDGTVVYVVDNPAGGRLRALVAPSLEQRATAALGQRLVAAAVTPDGTRLVVLDAAAGTATAWIVDTASLSIDGSAALPAGEPQALTISADGSRAYVVLRDGPNPVSIAALDLARLVVTGQPAALAGSAMPTAELAASTGAAPVAIVSTVAGDHLFVADGVQGTLASIPVGKAVPADWSPTGSVQLARVNGASPVVVLGDPAFSSASGDAGISQMVPVAAGCAYVLAFSADAELAQGAESVELGTVDAAADVFWLSAQCGLAGTETVPIATARRRSLPAYRIPLRAPAGATQAEIRFRAMAGTVVALSSVSLAGASDALSNGALRDLGADGKPHGWTVAPAGARLNVASSLFGVTRLRNAGTQTIDLAQAVDVPAQALGHVDFAARTADATTSPSLEIDFRANDGSALGTATSIAVGPGDFEQHPADVSVPNGSARVNIRLRLPPATTLDVSKLALAFADTVRVPLGFIAQAPGELRVSRAAVVYERVPAPPPQVPSTGLCTPTPPGMKPGDPCALDSCHCTRCNANRTMQRAAATATPSGRPATLGTCATCGTPMLRLGGLPSTVSASFATVQTPIALPSFVIPRTSATAALANAPRAASLPVTAVAGIGQARARMLAEAGIKTIDDLARANAPDIAKTLRGVTPANAEILIKHAQRLAASASQ